MSKPAQRAPRGLKTAGAKLWKDVTTSDPDGLTLRPDELAVLEQACRAADQITVLDAALVEAEPLIAGSRGQLVLHPAIAEVRQQRQLLASLLGRLDIPEDRDAIGSEWDGLSASERARKAARSRWPRAVA